ncbi:MAG: VWA domain-containing protein [Anaerolineales bacterium]|nr:VWA domain-containing protein [Anaerolineales bacterium]
MSHENKPKQQERERRWRLILGPADEENQESQSLSEEDQAMDDALGELYDENREGGLNDSKPDVARWLGDIRQYFPTSVVQLLQQDALDKIGLRKLLRHPDLLAEIEPDVQLISQILALNRVIPAGTRETARAVVQQVVDELLERLRFPMQQAIEGSLHRATRTKRPRHKEINWQRTIYTNLKHYQPSHNTVIPETMIGYGRKRTSLKDIILCIDQSGSMAGSIVYASIFGAVMASLPALTTHMVLFDTSILDMTNQLHDPVDLLFGVRLGGGTNIDRAIGYCQQLITRPRDTILVLISDLFEGGNKESLYRRVAELTSSGVQVVVLLALNDEGAPSFNREVAHKLLEYDIPSFACTPDLFPELMAAVLHGRDIRQWAASYEIVTAPNN